MDNNNVTLSRPKDKSLEAFKAWIQEVAQKMGAKKIDISEEEWKAKWIQFWSDESKESA